MQKAAACVRCKSHGCRFEVALILHRYRRIPFVFMIPASSDEGDVVPAQRCAEIAITTHMPFFLVSPKFALEDGEHYVETRLLTHVAQLDELVRATGQSLAALDAQLLSPSWLNEQSSWRLERLVGISLGRHPLKPRAQPATRFEVDSGRYYILKNDDRLKIDRFQWSPCL